MKNTLKLIAVITGGLIGAAIPLSAFYFFWSWCMAQVPLTLAWAGLAKVAITLGLILTGGGLTVALAFLCGTILGAIILAIVE